MPGNFSGLACTQATTQYASMAIVVQNRVGQNGLFQCGWMMDGGMVDACVFGATTANTFRNASCPWLIS
jgi:hypothetical protein